ncbi:hypothetical protein OS493_033745 [Desmophyllum pertusum]|uniref:Uncharacterized protein n=1 Tax=Desmophyllum pertusum TaxID=174260 RepID=A0A9W9ZAK6_9CNID|nr:hypothetical protein OS493_033745 [Desmophyllum pertusum]
MLSEQEKEGCKNILNKLPRQDLINLTDTVTNRVVSPENASEAVNAILTYSHTASQLLRRKKVKREHIYQYLAENGVIEPVASDKPSLIRKVLLYWGSTQEDSDDENDTTENLGEPTTEASKPTGTISSNVNAPSLDRNVDGQQLAEYFVPWFYKILNSFNTSPDNASPEWGPQHFWADAKGSVLMVSDGHMLDECQGSLVVSEKLRELVCKERLLFNANVNGAKGQIDAYGLVKISVGGTVHRFSDCLGIFEQSFGLIRDPQMQNNWKIKFTELKLKAQQQREVEGFSRKAIT